MTNRVKSLFPLSNDSQSNHITRISRHPSQQIPNRIQTHAINFSEIQFNHETNFNHQPKKIFHHHPSIRQQKSSNLIHQQISQEGININSRTNLSTQTNLNTNHIKRNQVILNNSRNAPITNLQASRTRLANQIHQHHQQRTFQQQLQHHQQNLERQQRLIANRQHQLELIEMNLLIDQFSDNEFLIRSRQEQNSQLQRINQLSNEAFSIIDRIQTNLDQQENQDFEFNFEDEDEFDVEDENGNLIHINKNENIPKTLLNKRLINQIELCNNLKCSICLNEFENDSVISVLNCGHIFHYDCIEPWVKKHPTCPMCRASTIS